MGFFSFKTSDTNESIFNCYSGEPMFTVYMVTEDGRTWVEQNYEGYGNFGGKDIYELIAELNGLTGREAAVDLVFQDNPSGDFPNVAERGIKLPKLFKNIDTIQLNLNRHKLKIL